MEGLEVGSSHGNIGTPDMHLLMFNYWRAQQAHSYCVLNQAAGRATPGAVKDIGMAVKGWGNLNMND